jgi:4-hydroxymandelate oxidase
VDIGDLEARAAEVLEPAAYAYFSGGADEESTLADNVAAWSRYRLRPRMLRDVSQVDLTTTVLGQAISTPVMIAPTAYHRLAHPDGECATARAAATAGTVLVVSTMATRTIEDIAAAADDAALWFQLYVHADRGMTTTLLKRAEAAGYRALVVTVDTPRLGNRRRDGLHGFTLPNHAVPVNLAASGVDPSNLPAYAASAFDPALTYEGIQWLCAQTTLPVVVKGILRGDDARSAVDAGARAVIVSNHGGRQLDGAVATADALAEVTDAVGDEAEVYVDGGVRRGTDVLRALAIGARAVFIGRPALWGLAVDGADGVGAVLDELRAETELAFTLAGVRSCTDAGRDLIAPPPRDFVR